MKKTAIILLMLCIAAFGYAERFMLLQGSLNQLSRSHTNGFQTNSYSFTSIGVNTLSFIGKQIGFFTSASILLPFKGEVNSVEIDINEYNALKLATELLAGPGYIYPISDTLSALFGAGLHLSCLAIGSSYTYDTELSYALGPGAGVSLIYRMNDNSRISIGICGGYDTMEIMRIPDLEQGVEYKGSPTFSINAGIGFDY